MAALTLHLPLALVMLCAVNWLFVIAAWKPHWFKQSSAERALWSTVEGLICALIWAVFKPIIEQTFGFTGLLDGAIAGLSWGGMSFYGKTRFKADLYDEEKNA
jgi:hypothetical protein